MTATNKPIAFPSLAARTLGSARTSHVALGLHAEAAPHAEMPHAEIPLAVTHPSYRMSDIGEKVVTAPRIMRHGHF